MTLQIMNISPTPITIYKGTTRDVASNSANGRLEIWRVEHAVKIYNN